MREQKKQLLRLLIVGALYIAAVIVHVSTDLPLYVELPLFAALYLAAGYDVLFKAARNLVHGQFFDENILMSLATVGAFFIREYADAVAVMLLYQTGELFQRYAVGKSRRSVAATMDLRPDVATVLRNGTATEIAAEEVETGEILLVKAGEKIAIDGVVVEGESLLDLSALTGESLPKEVRAGDEVLSGSINTTGVLHIRTTATFENSTVAKILQLVNSSEKKAKTESFITKFSKYYTPCVLFAAIVIGVVPPLFNGLWAEWLKRAMMFLFVSCPCALVISVPLSFFGGIGGAARQGILVKGGNCLETLNKANVFLFDKTGTLTEGSFAVAEIFPEENREKILRCAALAERNSLHPVALSIVKAAGDVPLAEGSVSKEIAGCGIVTQYEGNTVLCGNDKLMETFGVPYTPSSAVGTVVYVAENGVFLGGIVVTDALKKTSANTVSELKRQGAKVVMLTGDNRTAERVAQAVGVDECRCNLLPQDKAAYLDEVLRDKNNTAVFVGDGLNDAPVLLAADVGIAMGGVGSDAAIEAADIVLLQDDPAKVVTSRKIAKRTMRIVKENIVFSLTVKFSVLILSAVGVFSSLIPAILADVGVTVVAILNALRTLKKEKRRVA